VVNPARILEELNRARVDYVVIGGVAATLHGCPEQTYDLDIFYEASPENRARLLEALTAIGAQWEEPLSETTLQRQSVFSLNTNHGDLDIFTEVPGIKSYASVAATANVFEIEGAAAKALDLESLVAAKQAAEDPNPRKRAALAYLKEIQRRRASKSD
jgi:hypothetical protein